MAVYNSINDLPAFSKAVVTIGTFDGVHLGHRVILKKVVDAAQQTGGESILLTFEPHPRKLIFPDQPIEILTPLDKKLELLKETGIRHIVVVPFTKEFANLSAEEYISDFLVRFFHPAHIVIGYDHHFGHDRKGNIELLNNLGSKYGFNVTEIPAQLIDEAAISSTKIRAALATGNVADAAQMLGRPYSLAGIVQQGAQLGRTIGYPTANIRPHHSEQLVPAIGVYAVLVLLDGRRYKGMLSIGYNPTVTDDKTIKTEVHMFDFADDIYSREVEIFFIDRLRDEQKFDSLEALKQQLHLDKEHSLSILEN